MGEYFKKLIEHYASECSEERMIKLGNVRGAFTGIQNGKSQQEVQ